VTKDGVHGTVAIYARVSTDRQESENQYLPN
jgi:DNA invertase Pin-like site-specific DNA recombinase